MKTSTSASPSEPARRPTARAGIAGAPELADLEIRYPHAGRVDLRSRTLFADPGGDFCRGFVGRLFAVREVESLTIDRSGAAIRYAPGSAELPRLVRRIADALGRTGGRAADALHLGSPEGVPVCVRRYGDVLSTWEIRHAVPGRFRGRHPSLRRQRRLAAALREELRGVPGLLGCRIGLHTGSLVVHHDPRGLELDELLVRCEAALRRAEAREADRSGAAAFGVPGALLGLALAGHLVFPPLLAVAAALLVVANVPTFRRAWTALQARAVDTDVLYSGLLALTALSGDLLSIAVMAWSVAIWPAFLERRLARTRRALRVTRPVRHAVATEMERRVLESARLERPVPALPERAAPPRLVASARDTVTRGFRTTGFVLAPNYAGPELAPPLDRAATLLAGASAGVLVRGEPALVRLAEADALVVDASAGEPAEALVAGLLARGIEPTVLGAGRPADAGRLLRRLRLEGRRVAFLGRGDDLAAAREADVAIALGGLRVPPADVADVVLVSPRLIDVLDAVDLARLHAREARMNRHVGVWPTLLAGGGALALGFASLSVVLLTNVGALAVYWRGSRRLTAAEADWQSSPRLTAAEADWQGSPRLTAAEADWRDGRPGARA